MADIGIEHPNELRPDPSQTAPIITNQETTEKTAEKAEQANDGDEEAGESDAAFNPETGEINWDCPCLYVSL